MKVRFDVNDPAVRTAFLQTGLAGALASLRFDDAPRWGRMSAQQMVEHLLWTFEVSTGRIAVACPVALEKRERLKQFLYDNRPTPAEFMNPLLREGLPALRFAGLPEAMAALGQEVEAFLARPGSDPDSLYAHPLFGPLGFEDWSRSHFKHGCHHLLQFRLVEVAP